MNHNTQKTAGGVNSGIFNHKLFSILLALLCLTAFANFAEAATYYVDAASGDDTNPGSSAQPWKTLGRTYTWYNGAGTKVTEGDTLLFRDGDYGEFLETTNTNPGQDYLFYRNDWITYKADTGHSPVLTNIDIKNLDKWAGAGNGRSYLSFEGFEIQDGVLIRNTSYVKLIDCEIHATPTVTTGYYQPYFLDGQTGVSTLEAHYITIQDSEISNLYRGMQINGNHYSITGNTIHHITEDGIVFSTTSSTDDILIDGNLIYDHRHKASKIKVQGTISGTFVPGETVTQDELTGIVVSQESGYIFVFVTSQSTPYRGFRTTTGTAPNGNGSAMIGSTSGAKIDPIILVDGSHTDCIQFDSIGADTILANLQITNNIFDMLRPATDPGNGTDSGQCLKLVGNDLKISGNIENNVFAGTTSVMLQGMNNVIFNNNTCYGSENQGWLIYTTVNGVNAASSFAEFHNNIIDYPNIKNTGINVTFISQGNNIFSPKFPGSVDMPVADNMFLASSAALDALFEDAASSDYSLTRNSLAVGFADPTKAPATDITGAARGNNPDAGAYEFIGITANAGPDQATKDTNVTLDGSASESSDPNSNPITRYLWTCDPAINGGDPNLYDGANSSATVTLPNDATAHTITLTVFDGDGNSDSDTVDITVYDYSINTSSDADGSITIQGKEDQGEGDFYYGTGDIVDIIAEPVSILFEFVNWSVTPAYNGDPNYFADPTNSTTNIQMNQDYTLTANFQLKPTLTISSGVGGSVTTPGEDVYPYNSGTTLNLAVTATPAAGYRFNGWTGTATVAAPALASTTVTSTINSDMTLIANFTKIQTITISSTTNGSVTIPGEAAYTDDLGESMAITATRTPPTGYFINWTGTAVTAGAVADPTAASTTVTFSGDYTLIANFGIDATGPIVTAVSPTAGYLYAPTNSLVSLTVTDTGIGVDPTTVNIVVSTPNDPNVLVYTGDVEEYTSATGTCRRTGTPAAYTYYYDPNTAFNAEDEITITVDANDLQTPTSNDTTGETYFFVITTPIFGVNDYVNYDGTTDASNVDTVTDPLDGAILAVWQQVNASGTNDIYYGKLPAGEYYFDVDEETKLTDTAVYDQVNPLIDTDGTELYIVWQEGEPNGLNNIVIYYTDPNWVGPLNITDPNNTTDQANPAMAIDSAGKIYVTWLEDNDTIKVSTSTDPNASWDAPINVDTGTYPADTQPSIAIDENDVAYIVWENNGIVYGATSGDNWGSRTTIDSSGGLANPVIATESTGTVLHLLWDDGAEVYHCQTTDGLTAPNTYTITDITGAAGAQTNPTIAVNGTSVYAAWVDAESGNPDIFYAEKTGSIFGSNIQINDDGGTTAQLEPVINLDSNSKPYILWSDNRTTKQSIYYAAATFIGSALKSATVDASAGTDTIVEIDGTTAGVIDDANDVVVTIPAGAIPADTTITISRLYNPPKPPANSIGLFYEFGPSGLTFTSPVTITIPHPAADDNPDHDTWTIYWFDYSDETWKTDGTAFVSHNTSADPHTITFTTTHFSSFGVVGSIGPVTPPSGGDSGSGAGGGGCSVSPYGGGSILEFLLPYAVIGLVLAGLKLKSRRRSN